VNATLHDVGGRLFAAAEVHFGRTTATRSEEMFLHRIILANSR